MRPPFRTPSGAGTLLYVAAALLIVMVVIAVTRPALILFQVAVVLAGLFGPRWYQRRRFTNDIYQRTRQITKDEEYEADMAQNRSRLRAILSGDYRAALFRTYWENVRKRARPSRYVAIRFSRSVEGILSDPLRMWLPQRKDVVAVVRRWPPIFQPFNNHGSLPALEALHRQIATFFGYGTTDDGGDPTGWPAPPATRTEILPSSTAPLATTLPLDDLNRFIRRTELNTARCYAVYKLVRWDLEAYDVAEE